MGRQTGVEGASGCDSNGGARSTGTWARGRQWDTEGTAEAVKDQPMDRAIGRRNGVGKGRVRPNAANKSCPKSLVEMKIHERLGVTSVMVGFLGDPGNKWGIEWLLRWSQFLFVPRGKGAIAEEGRGPWSGPTAGALIGQRESRECQSMTYFVEGTAYEFGYRIDDPTKVKKEKA